MADDSALSGRTIFKIVGILAAIALLSLLKFCRCRLSNAMKQIVKEALKSNRRLLAAPRPKVLHQNSSEFLKQLQRYLYCRDAMDQKYEQVDEYHRIARLKLVTDSGGIEKGRDKYKPEYMQRAITGQPVKNLDELYTAAEMAQPIFKEKLVGIVRAICGKQDPDEVAQVVVAPLKGRDRAAEKARDDYIFRNPGPPEAWLYDIVRASILFSDCNLLANCLEYIQKDPNIHIVKAKNRFKTPTLSGYRDCNLCIRIDCRVNGNHFSHICEVQIHHNGIKKLDKELDTHSCYEYFRTYFLGSTGSLEERLRDLRRINQGKVLNVKTLNKALESDDAERIESLAVLLGDKIGDLVWSRLLYARLTIIYHNKKNMAKMAVAFRKQGEHEASEACSFLESPPPAGEETRVIGQDQRLHLLRDLRIRDPLVNEGVYFLQKGNKEQAREKLMAAAQTYIEDGGGSMEEGVAVLFEQVGKLEDEAGNLASSIEWHSKALDIQQRILGVNHPWVCESEAALFVQKGEMDVLNKKYVSALEWHCKAIDIQIKTLGSDHPSVKESRVNIAVLQVILENDGINHKGDVEC